MYMKVHQNLHRHQHAGILIPGQQRVLPITGLCVLNICPTMHKVLMTQYLGQFSSHSTVDIFNNVEVRWEEDIKIALMNLRAESAAIQRANVIDTYKWRRDRHHLPLVPSLHDRGIQTRDGVRQGIEITCHQAVGGEVLVEYIKELH